jgi:hypothetical protein
MKKKNLIKLDPSVVNSRLGLCAAALAGTAAAVTSADATIITFTTPVVVPATFAGVYINLGTGATGGSGGGTPGWDFNPYAASGLTQLGFYWNPTPGPSGGVASTTSGPYLSLAPGTMVSGASTFSATILGTTGSPYLTTGTHILGFRFFNETTGAVNYGYMTMTNTGGGTPSGFPTTILNWSYDDTGAPITVVPEPATAALLSIGALVLGALGLREWRRQRAA